MMKKLLRLMGIVCLAAAMMLSSALAQDAEDIASQCKFKSDSNARKAAYLYNGNFSTYWQSGARRNPYLIIESPEPMYGLYICFREMPETYLLQRYEGDEWVTIAEGDTRFHHVFYELEGETKLRIYSTQSTSHSMKINSLSVLGEGEVPGWVQRWEETYDKAELLLLVAHPDDDLVFFAGAIPTYAVEMDRRVVIAYLTYCDKTRRSETLNALWSMGVRNYPVFGAFKDNYARSLNEAYKEVSGSSVKAGKEKVWQWVTELFRKYKPEVVLSQDVKGEYGHGQHLMIADASIQCYDLAADPTYHPESAELYSAWAVRKLYLHLYGDESNQLRMLWNTPLITQGGRTGMQAAEEAFTYHVSQNDQSYNTGKKRVALSVEEFGSYYDNTLFGLYASRVGEDVAKNDFLENIDPVVPTAADEAPADQSSGSNVGLALETEIDLSAIDGVVHITDATGLQAIAEDPWGSYVLDNDIDMTGIDWTPLRFFGTFDGQGFSIRNLSVSTFDPLPEKTVDGNGLKYDTYMMAFFSVCANATVRNVSFTDAMVRGKTADHAYVAIAAAVSTHSVFENVSVSGSAALYGSAKMVGVGGLVGFGTGSITDSRADVTLVFVDTNPDQKCEQFMGAAVSNGYMDCVNVSINIDGYASVTGYVHCGGLVGMHRQYEKRTGLNSTTTITGCTSTGCITFFENNTDRRAYCKGIIGEKLNKYVTMSNNDSTGFKRNEIKKYDEILLPEGWE